MEQNIRIFVLGIQNAGSGPETILTRADGIYCFEEGFHRVSYRESDQYGNTTDNILSFTQEEVRLRKSGSISGHFLFRPCEKTPAGYLSPYGKIDFQVETEYYSMDENEECLDLQMEYRLYSEGALFSENTLNIRISGDSERGI